MAPYHMGPVRAGGVDWLATWHEMHVRVNGVREKACEGDRWLRRADRFDRSCRQASREPLPTVLVERLRPDDVVIDIGAGTGRHTILFAQACRRVVAVEPSAAMRAHLTQRVREEGLDNVEVVDAAWPSRGALEGDIVFSSHVLYGVEDAAAFLSAMDAVARRLCALVLGISAPSDALAPLWHRVHGVEMPRRPAALEALNLLYHLGVPASLWPLPESVRPVSLRTSEDEIALLCSRLSLEPCATNVARVRAAVATLATTDTDDGYRVGTRGPNALVWWAPRGVPW